MHRQYRRGQVSRGEKQKLQQTIFLASYPITFEHVRVKQSCVTFKLLSMGYKKRIVH